MLEKRDEGSKPHVDGEQSHSPAMTHRELPLSVQKERRKRPRVRRGPETPLPPSELSDYAAVISAPELEELRILGQSLAGKSIRVVSPPPRNDMAELQFQRARLLHELGLNLKYDTGSYRNQSVTGPTGLRSAHKERAAPEAEITGSSDSYISESRSFVDRQEDFIIFDDVSALELISPESKTNQLQIWRCTSDPTGGEKERWPSFRSLAERCDAVVLTAAAYAGPLSTPQYVIYPSVDPLSERNKQLDPSYIERVCSEFSLDRSRPIVSQISSFSSTANQLEIIQAYRLAKRYVDCQLVMAGVIDAKDPDAPGMLEELRRVAQHDSDVKVLLLADDDRLKLNAIERASTLVVHTPVREAFGVAVVEALWKGKPVIASAVGSISNQVIHQFTGALVHSVEGCAYQIRYLLTHPEIAEQLGKNGREHVKENFLITSELKKWLVLFQILLSKAGRGKELAT